jgi:acetyl-CoA acetyltransferase
VTTNAIITGIGQSAVGRLLGRSPLSLTAESALQAIADAGLQPADIDGVSTWPGAASMFPGSSGVGVYEIQDALGLRLEWFSGAVETAGQFGAVINAVNAIAAGLCDHVLVFRTVWESTAQGGARRAGMGAGQRIDDWTQWYLPFGAVSPANWTAWLARAHFDRYGTTREQLSAIAINQRINAALNPKAIFRKPLTLDEYMNSRVISDPLCLFDCDVPIDGSTSIIVSRSEARVNAGVRTIRIEAMSGASYGRPRWDMYEDLASMTAEDVGASLWKRTELTPADVDMCHLYDGFSFLALIWLEALRLCPKGEGGAFVEGGSRIALNGDLPMNTGGGQLSAGRLHGFGHLHEACLQLRKEAGERQLARAPEVAVVAAGGGQLAGALLLTTYR